MSRRILSVVSRSALWSDRNAIMSLLLFSPSTTSCSSSPTSVSRRSLVTALRSEEIWMCVDMRVSTSRNCGSAVMSARMLPVDSSPFSLSPPPPSLAALFLAWNSLKRCASVVYTSAMNMWRSSHHSASSSSSATSRFSALPLVASTLYLNMCPSMSSRSYTRASYVHSWMTGASGSYDLSRMMRSHVSRVGRLPDADMASTRSLSFLARRAVSVWRAAAPGGSAASGTLPTLYLMAGISLSVAHSVARRVAMDDSSASASRAATSAASPISLTAASGWPVTVVRLSTVRNSRLPSLSVRSTRMSGAHDLMRATASDDTLDEKKMCTEGYSGEEPEKSSRICSTESGVGVTKYTPAMGSGSRALCRSSTTDTWASRMSLILSADDSTFVVVSSTTSTFQPPPVVSEIEPSMSSRTRLRTAALTAASAVLLLDAIFCYCVGQAGYQQQLPIDRA
mmetsp:Transcript_27740/g.70705  ORF Transcript_27740/g.70705 Transcript_27740/m.70705 type:complete len:453 (-) Transcript_27740:120-1478(-)